MSIETMIQVPQHLLGKLAAAPENAPGTHLVNCILKDRTLLGVTVVNGCVALIDPDENICSKDILDIKL
jgi:hypothetical protein